MKKLLSIGAGLLAGVVLCLVIGYVMTISSTTTTDTGASMKEGGIRQTTHKGME